MTSLLNRFLNDHRYNKLVDCLDDVDYFFERHLKTLYEPVGNIYGNVSDFLWNNSYGAYINKTCDALIVAVQDLDVPSFKDNKKVMSVFKEVLLYSGLSNKRNVSFVLCNMVEFASSYRFENLPGISECKFQEIETEDWHMKFNESMHSLCYSTSYSSIFEALYCYVKWVESSGYLNNLEKSLFFRSM